MSTLGQVGSISLVVAAHECVVLVYASAVNCKETKKTTTSSVAALKIDKVEIFVLVELVLSAFGGGIGKVSSRRTILVRVHEGGVSGGQCSRGE